MSDESNVTNETNEPPPAEAPDATAEVPAVTADATAEAPAVPDASAPDLPVTPEPYHEPRAAADDSPRPAEPVVEVNSAVIDPALLSESEAAAAKRAETAAAVALVAAVAASKAEAAAEAAAAVQPVVEETRKKPGKIKALRAVVAMLIRAALVLALFVGGYVLGQTAFNNNQAAEVPTTIVDPSTAGAQPPAVVREFVGALSSGDADALRSSLQAEPHARLTSEFRRFGIQTISGVETLSTHVDGSRSATEIVMQGTTTSGVPISINLVVLADGNAIEGFR